MGAIRVVDRLQDLSDVDVTALADGHVLRYNSTTSKFEIVQLSGADVGLPNVNNTSDTTKPVSIAQQTALDAKQNSLGFVPLDPANNLSELDDVVMARARLGLLDAATHAASDFQPQDTDLSAIAALTPASDDIIQRKAGVWTNRSPTQLKTDLALSGTNTGDQTTVSGNAGTATALQTPRTIDGQSFDGTANITVIAPATHAAPSKATPVDADELPLVDSASSNTLKRLTWTALKVALKTYLDTLYQVASAALDAWAGKTAPSGTVVGTTDAQTLTNKKLGSLVTNGPVFTSGADGTLNSEAQLASSRGGTGSAFFAISGPTVLRAFVFPDAAATIARTDAGQTFNGTNTFAGSVDLGAQLLKFTQAWMKSGASGEVAVRNNVDTAYGIFAATKIRIYDSSSNVQIGLSQSNAGQIELLSGGRIDFATSATQANGTKDVGLRRNAAGVLEVDDGVTLGTFRDLKLRDLTANGNLIASAAGKGLQLQSGSGARAGNATLVGGTVTVANATVTVNTVIILTRKTSGGTIGTAVTYTINAGVSFTINSDNILDTSIFSYLLIEVN